MDLTGNQEQVHDIRVRNNLDYETYDRLLNSNAQRNENGDVRGRSFTITRIVNSQRSTKTSLVEDIRKKYILYIISDANREF
jgi:flagellar motor switch protein FliG